MDRSSILRGSTRSVRARAGYLSGAGLFVGGASFAMGPFGRGASFGPCDFPLIMGFPGQTLTKPIMFWENVYLSRKFRGHVVKSGSCRVRCRGRCVKVGR